MTTRLRHERGTNERFNGTVWVDFRARTMRDEFPSGTHRFPVNNLSDARLIAVERGFETVTVIRENEEENMVITIEALEQILADPREGVGLFDEIEIFGDERAHRRWVWERRRAERRPTRNPYTDRSVFGGAQGMSFAEVYGVQARPTYRNQPDVIREHERRQMLRIWATMATPIFRPSFLSDLTEFKPTIPFNMENVAKSFGMKTPIDVDNCLYCRGEVKPKSMICNTCQDLG